jgi:hypothetical protein
LHIKWKKEFSGSDRIFVDLLAHTKFKIGRQGTSIVLSQNGSKKVAKPTLKVKS